MRVMQILATLLLTAVFTANPVFAGKPNGKGGGKGGGNDGGGDPPPSAPPFYYDVEWLGFPEDPQFPLGFTTSPILDINNLGLCVGRCTPRGSSLTMGFLWSSAQGFVLLDNQLAIDAPEIYENYTVIGCSSVNDSNTIVGTVAERFSGTHYAFRYKFVLDGQSTFEILSYDDEQYIPPTVVNAFGDVAYLDGTSGNEIVVLVSPEGDRMPISVAGATRLCGINDSCQLLLNYDGGCMRYTPDATNSGFIDLFSGYSAGGRSGTGNGWGKSLSSDGGFCGRGLNGRYKDAAVRFSNLGQLTPVAESISRATAINALGDVAGHQIKTRWTPFLNTSVGTQRQTLDLDTMIIEGDRPGWDAANSLKIESLNDTLQMVGFALIWNGSEYVTEGFVLTPVLP